MLKIVENSLHLFPFVFKPCRVLRLPRRECINSISLFWKTTTTLSYFWNYRSKLLDQSMWKPVSRWSRAVALRKHPLVSISYIRSNESARKHLTQQNSPVCLNCDSYNSEPRSPRLWACFLLSASTLSPPALPSPHSDWGCLIVHLLKSMWFFAHEDLSALSQLYGEGRPGELNKPHVWFGSRASWQLRMRPWLWNLWNVRI